MELTATSQGRSPILHRRNPTSRTSNPFVDLLTSTRYSQHAAEYSSSVATAADMSDEMASARRVTDSTEPAAGLKEAIDASKKEASMTPAQKACRDVLKLVKVPESDLKAMNAARRDACEKRIAEKVACLLRRRAQAVPKCTEAANKPSIAPYGCDLSANLAHERPLALS